MSLSNTINLLAGEAFIFGAVWVFYSAGKPVVAAILFVALHLIAHNGHVGVRDKNEAFRNSARKRAPRPQEDEDR